MRRWFEEISEWIAIVALAFLGYWLIKNQVDYFLMLTDIVAIAGIAGYKITKVPARTNVEKK